MTGLVMMNMFNTGSRQVMAAVLQMEGKARLAQIGLFMAPWRR